MIEPQEPIEKFLEKDSHKRKPVWAWEILQEVERYGTIEGIHRDKKKEKYTIAMCPCCVTSLIKNLPPMKRI